MMNYRNVMRQRQKAEGEGETSAADYSRFTLVCRRIFDK